eukprot:gene6609-6837_t
MRLVITAPPEAVHTVILPAIRVLQQLAAGVHSLSMLSANIIQQLQYATDSLQAVIQRLDDVMHWVISQKQQEALAKQQLLSERAGQLGQLLMLLGMAVAAVGVGRAWEVHQVCISRGQHHQVSWQQRLTGTGGLTQAWGYTCCCAEQLGLYGVGLLALYWFVKASALGLLSFEAAGVGRWGHTPSRAWQLDLLGFAAQAALLEAFPLLNKIHLLEWLLGRLWRLHV